MDLDPTGVIYAVASGAVTSGLGYILWYAALLGVSLVVLVKRQPESDRAGSGHACRGAGGHPSAWRQPPVYAALRQAPPRPPKDRPPHDIEQRCPLWDRSAPIRGRRRLGSARL